MSSDAAPERRPHHAPAARRRTRGDARATGGDEMQMFVEHVHDYAVFLMDPAGFVVRWGRGAERIKEHTAEEAVGLHLSDLYPVGGAEDGTAEEHLRLAAEQGEYIGEGTRLARHRGPFPARVVLTALRRGGELYGFSKVTQDLTERKRIEARLQEALREARAGNEEKARFLATMSHEIRTPINAVLGYADLLDLAVAGPLTETQRGYVDRIRAGGRHLRAIVEDVLDFARVEAGRLAVAPRQAPAAAAVESALSMVRPQAEARGQELQVDCDPAAEYWGDETRVRQILANLLVNAVKFTGPGGRIRLTCACGDADPEAELRGDGPWTCVRVEDTGIGIPEDRLSAVFEPFVQVDGELTRAHQGTGLGLAISRRLARLMGGDLTVRSRAGAGSGFALWLPAGPAAAERPGGPGSGGEPSRSLTPVGHRLGDAAHRVVHSFTRRLRVDPALPHARERSRSELEDHTATLVTDLAQLLVVLEEDGEDASATARDGAEVQELLARRHGQQRRRLGWTEAGLRREFEILREEIERVLRDLGGTELAQAAVDESLRIVERRLAGAAEVSVRAFREAPAPG